MMAEILRDHLRYTARANDLLVQAARQLSPEELNRDFGTADKSVLGTLVHIFGGDRIWLERIRGNSLGYIARPEDHDFERLQAAWPEVQEGWNEWAAGLTDATALDEIRFRTVSGDEFVQPAWQIVMHLVNHGTHHRGAVSGFLRSMGKTPPKLDLMFYYRMQATRSAAS